MKSFCEPAKLYLIISVIFLIFAVFHQISALTLIVKGIFIVIWTMVLNWLCSKGFSGLAWIIVLLPFLAIFVTMFTTMDLINGGGGYEGFGGTDKILPKQGPQREYTRQPKKPAKPIAY